MSETSKKEINSGSKSRKSRNEIIRSSLTTYLKQKNYIDTEKFRKADLVLLQTPKQFIFNKMIEFDTSHTNSFTYSNVLCLSNNYTIVDQQFKRFLNFVKNQKEDIKKELSNLFGPIICHLYIELLKGKDWKPAFDFLRNYAYLVAPVENLNAPLNPTKINGCSTNIDQSGLPVATTQILFTNENSGDVLQEYFKELIQNLSSYLRTESFEGDDAIILFRSSKYEIDLSFESVNALKGYLSKMGHLILMNIIQTWIHINIKELHEDFDMKNSKILSEEPDEDDEKLIKVKDEIHIKTEKIEYDEISSIKDDDNESLSSISISKLKNSCEKLQNSELFTRLLKITDSPNKRVSCSDIDFQNCHIAAGYNQSLIKLWALNKQAHTGKNLYTTFIDKLCDFNIVGVNDEEFSDEDSNLLATNEDHKKKRKLIENSFDESGGISLVGHSKGVTDIKFSRNYPLILSTSQDLTMRAWQASNYTCGSIYRGHNYPIWCLTESPIGPFVATGSRDYTARLWCLERKSPLITYVGHTQDVDCVSFHPNGNYIATGSCDLTVRLWCTTSGKLFRVFTDCRFPITSLCFSPNGKYLAVGGDETKIRLYDLAAGCQISELKDYTSPISSISWNKLGTRITSSCINGNIKTWDCSLKCEESTTIVNKLIWQITTNKRTLKVIYNSDDFLSLVICS